MGTSCYDMGNSKGECVKKQLNHKMISHVIKCQNGLKFNAKQKLGLGGKENRRKPRNGKRRLAKKK